MIMQLKDYYKTLELTPAATAIQIKKSFRQLALRHHPDINPGNAIAEARFREIQEAYEVLSDPDKREEYNYKRWYNRSIKKEFSNEPLTPAAILAESIRLYNYMLSTDTTRVDYDALSYHIRQLLSDRNVTILQQSGNPDSSATLIEKILPAAGALPLRYIEPIVTALLRVAADNAVLVERITAFSKQQRQKSNWQKYQVAVVVAITILLCWLIYTIGS